MMMGPMAGCPMGAGAPGMTGRYMMGPGMMGPGMMTGMGTMGSTGGSQAGSVDAQLEALHAELAVTTDQEDAWRAYAEAARADAQVMVDMHGRMTAFMQGGSTAATDWAQVHADMMRARADSLEALTGAVEALYAELDDSQKATFDRTGGGLCGAW
jgi:hypothetical protein